MKIHQQMNLWMGLKVECFHCFRQDCNLDRGYHQMKIHQQKIHLKDENLKNPSRPEDCSEVREFELPLLERRLPSTTEGRKQLIIS
jgi:hypothetical protein